MSTSVAHAFSFLIEAAIGLYLVAVLLRLLLEWVRADYYNPLCQFLLTVTEPLAAPLARAFPRVGRLNTAVLLLLLLLQFIQTLLIQLLAGHGPDLLPVLLSTPLRLLRMLLVLYLFLIIAQVILSWVGQTMRHPILPLIWQLTEPVLRPIRSVLPAIAGFDLSPLVAILGIQFLLILLGLR